MTTIIKSAISTSDKSGQGYDYTFSLLSTWEASENACPADLVTPDVQAIAECFNDWPSGLTDSCQIANRTTSATQNIIINVPESERHYGTPASGFYMIPSANWAEAIEVIDDPYVTVIGMDVENNKNGYSYRITSNTNPPRITLEDCIHKTTDSGVSNGGFYIDEVNLIKCLVVGTAGSYDGINVEGFSHALIADCVVADSSDIGILLSSTNSTNHPLIRNCVAYNSAGNDFSCADNIAGQIEYCASSDTTVLTYDATNSIDGITSTDFADAANDDYHLSTDSNLIGAGVNLYSDFTTDIDGDEWPNSGAWDIGFDYYVSAGSGITGTASGQLQAITGSATATNQVPDFSGTATGLLAAITGNASGTTSTPGFTGIAVGTLSAIIGNASGLTVAPDFIGTGAGVLSQVTGSASGNANNPGFSGTGAGILSAITGNATGDIDNPGFSGSAAGVLAGITGNASGQVVNAGTVGSGAGVLSPITGSASGNTTVPDFNAIGAGVLSGIIGAASATFYTDDAIGFGAGVLPQIIASASGVVVNPISTLDLNDISIELINDDYVLSLLEDEIYELELL